MTGLLANQCSNCRGFFGRLWNGKCQTCSAADAETAKLEVQKAYEAWAAGPIAELEELRAAVMRGETDDIMDRFCSMAFEAGYEARRAEEEE